MNDLYTRSFYHKDKRLNELRRMTGALIDLQDRHCTFERVDWTIAHCRRDVRDFVARRLHYWMQQTQIVCDTVHEDAVFVQEQRNAVLLAWSVKYRLCFFLVDSQRRAPIALARRGRTQSLTRASVLDIDDRLSRCICRIRRNEHHSTTGSCTCATVIGVGVPSRCSSHQSSHSNIEGYLLMYTRRSMPYVSSL